MDICRARDKADRQQKDEVDRQAAQSARKIGERGSRRRAQHRKILADAPKRDHRIFKQCIIEKAEGAGEQEGVEREHAGTAPVARHRPARRG
jgi:hypothetical protein